MGVVSGIYFLKDKKDTQPQKHYRKDYKKPDFIVETVNLVVDLRDDGAIVENKMKVHRAAYADKSAAFVLNGEKQELMKVTLNGTELNAREYASTSATLSVPNVGESFDLVVVSKNYPQKNTELEGLYKAGTYT